MLNLFLNIEIERILIFYDIPQLFVAQDSIGTKYVCLYVEENEINLEYNYVAISISKRKLKLLMTGQIDVRDAFEHPETHVWYVVNFMDSSLTISLAPFTQIKENFLPEFGLYIPETKVFEESPIIEESISLNNTVVHLSIVDNKNSNSVEVDLLGNLIKLFQSLVKNTYKKTLSQIQHSKLLDAPENFTLRVVGFSQGSFNVHLVPSSSPDLFGNSNIDIGLTQIDKIIGDVTDETAFLEHIKPYTGHSITAYKKMLVEIIKKDIKFIYKWTSNSSYLVHTKVIDKIYAQQVYDILTSKSELSQEIKVFTGLVKQADVANRHWRILDMEDQKEYSGRAANIDLAGITLDEVIYRFTCEEIIEELKINDSEKISYVLISYERI